MGDAAHSFGPRERAVLDFEREWVGRTGRKQDAIQERFGISASRYYQLLTRIVDGPEARDYDPLLVKRLQRRRLERDRGGRAAAPRRGGAPGRGSATRRREHR